MHKYNYTYKIINNDTNQYYIGVRSCDCEILEDHYMGSSTIWNKQYIATNKSKLSKIILHIFSSRKEANDNEVFLLKQCQNDPLCINQYFDYTPDVSGTIQSEEWINKRKMFGEKNGMFNKHHSEKTKQIISQKLTGRILSEATKEKIGSFHKGKVYGFDTRNKISKARQKLRHIKNILTNEEWDISITEFIKLFPEENLNANTMRKAAQENHIYKKKYIITDCEAFTSDSNSKLGENGERLEVDNPVGSIGSE